VFACVLQTSTLHCYRNSYSFISVPRLFASWRQRFYSGNAKTWLIDGNHLSLPVHEFQREI
jgi:hypothetical protein